MLTTKVTLPMDDGPHRRGSSSLKPTWAAPTRRISQDAVFLGVCLLITETGAEGFGALARQAHVDDV
ncbi:hypothetical protein [Streptomyces sp. NPDC003393]